MRIGLLSDTHGNVSRTRAAIGLLKAHGVDHVVHCGDVGSEAVLDELVAGFCADDIPVHVVLGNVDAYDEDLARYPTSTGLTVLGQAGDLSLGGVRVAIVHGHEAGRLRAAIQSGQYAYVFTGHTHEADDRTLGTTRLINPGAVHRSASPSVALLDTSTGALQSIPLRDGAWA